MSPASRRHKHAKSTTPDASRSDSGGEKAPRLLGVTEILSESGISRAAFENAVNAGLLHEAERTPGGRRRFDPDVLVRIAIIEGLKKLGYSLRDIRDTFSEGFAPPSRRHSS